MVALALQKKHSMCGFKSIYIWILVRVEERFDVCGIVDSIVAGDLLVSIWKPKDRIENFTDDGQEQPEAIQENKHNWIYQVALIHVS